MTSVALGKLTKVVLKSSHWWYVYRRAGRQTNSANTQTQIQGFNLAHPNIYLIYEVLNQERSWSFRSKSARSP